MDGNKKKKNLFIIGTSNRLKQMDDAILQRFDLKLFIGLPDSAGRQSWIRNKINRPATIIPKQKRSESELIENNEREWKEEKRLKYKQWAYDQINIQEIIVNILIGICESDKLYMSKHFISSLIGDDKRFC